MSDWPESIRFLPRSFLYAVTVLTSLDNPQQPRSRSKASGPKPAPKKPPAFSVRLVTTPNVWCALCGQPVGMGPVGHRDDQALCDLCMLRSQRDLGMLLALADVTRCSVASPEDPSAIRELGIFAQIYEQVAAVWGPPRQVKTPPDEVQS